MPDLGSNKIDFGKNETAKYGKLIPMPIKKKIINKVVEVCVNAIVKAEPTNGAVQGVANKVAKKPLKKFLVKKLFPKLYMLLFLKTFGKFISKIPSVFKQKKVRINNINIKKYGSWNCIPHDTEIPICLSSTKNKANNENDETIPNAV